MLVERLRLLVAAATLATACTPSTPPPDNVLLISIDSLRADRLGTYGGRPDVSPTLDRLAREGARFAQAFSPTSWTLPSHVTLLTGLAQLNHAVLLQSDRMQPRQPTLAEHLGARDFHTVGIYSGPFLRPFYGFDRGFDRYESCETVPATGSPRLGELRGSHDDQTNECVVERFESWTTSRPAGRFFAFVHLWDPHYDYIAPPRYRAMFDADYDGPLDGRDIAGAGFPSSPSARDLAHLLALYDAEIRYTDDTVGRLLDALDAVELLDRTLVVVTADHGDEFSEHGGKGHRRTLFDEVVHVPLILWASDGPRWRGRVVATPVGLRDVAPTILELLDVEPPSGLDGQSLVPLLRGEAVTARPLTAMLYSQARGGTLTHASVRNLDTKVLFDAQTETRVRYDLRHDRDELAPLPPLASDLTALLERQVARGNALLEARRDGRPAPELPSDLQERLRSLGYL